MRLSTLPEPGDLSIARSPSRTARSSEILRLSLCLPIFVAMLAVVPPVFTRGEAREGLVVQSLLEGGDWIAPRREGRLASKPPLYHWTAAGLARVFGHSEMTLRLPSAIAAWGMMVGTYALGLALFDRRRAWLAAGTLLSTVGFWRSALEARVDMLFAAAITAALAGFAWWLRTCSTNARWLVFLGTAAAVLTKGPAGVVIVGAVVVATLLAAREGRRSLQLLAPGPVVAAATVVLGWYALAYHRAGSELVAVQIVRENVERAVGFGAFERQRHVRPLKMLEAFATLLLPWNLTLLDAWRLPGGWQSRFLHSWWIVVLAFFTVAAGKRVVYLLPLYPAIAVIAADWLERRVGTRAWVLPTVAALAVAMSVGTVIAVRREAAASPLPAFVDAVTGAAPARATVGVQGEVGENDRLVLAYRLHRPVSRIRRDEPRAELMVVPQASVERLGAGCTPRASGHGAHHDALVLVECPAGSFADQRGEHAVGR
jgi:4-amino-4-deoxy-L-arabinose transferase-like glycosyltransferase